MVRWRWGRARSVQRRAFDGAQQEHRRRPTTTPPPSSLLTTEHYLTTESLRPTTGTDAVGVVTPKRQILTWTAACEDWHWLVVELRRKSSPSFCLIYPAFCLCPQSINQHFYGGFNRGPLNCHQQFSVAAGMSQRMILKRHRQAATGKAIGSEGWKLERGNKSVVVATDLCERRNLPPTFCTFPASVFSLGPFSPLCLLQHSVYWDRRRRRLPRNSQWSGSQWRIHEFPKKICMGTQKLRQNVKLVDNI